MFYTYIRGKLNILTRCLFGNNVNSDSYCTLIHCCQLGRRARDGPSNGKVSVGIK